MSATITREQITGFVEIIHSIAEAIRELGTVSDGTLYAALMGKLSLGHYKYVLRVLVDAKLITNDKHQIRWIGGTPK